jgi:hypothetical protein
VIEILDILRRQRAGDDSRVIERSVNIERNTFRKYIRIAEEKGHQRATDTNLEDIAYAFFSEKSTAMAVPTIQRPETAYCRRTRKSITEWLIVTK